MKEIVVVGLGGHSRSIREILKRENKFHNTLSIEELTHNKYDYDNYIVAIGDIKKRSYYFDLLKSRSKEIETIISCFSTVCNDVEIGEGTVVMPGAIIRTNATIKENCIINTGAIIEHDVSIGKSVNISPGAVVCGEAYIGDCVFIGAGAIVIDKVKIKSGTIIGAGAIVIQDIEDAGTYVGNPARRVN